MAVVIFGVLLGQVWGIGVFWPGTTWLTPLLVVRFGHNKCGKVLETEVDQIYTLCQNHRSLRFDAHDFWRNADWIDKKNKTNRASFWFYSEIFGKRSPSILILDTMFSSEVPSPWARLITWRVSLCLGAWPPCIGGRPFWEVNGDEPHRSPPFATVRHRSHWQRGEREKPMSFEMSLHDMMCPGWCEQMLELNITYEQK